MSTYDASSIRVLTGLEPVRARPAMYIGSTGEDGLHHLVHEVVDNCVDEAIAGFGRRISVTLHLDESCEIVDEGRGIPVDVHPETGRPACEVVLTTLHAGGKFDERTYRVSGGLHGVGVSCVNALSEWLELEVRRDGHAWRMRCERGEVTTELTEAGAAEMSGTRVHFLPDAQIFGEGRLSFEQIGYRLRELSFLLPGVAFDLSDLREGNEAHHLATGGLSAFVAHLNQGRPPVHPSPILLTGERDGVRVDVALQWTGLFTDVVRSYANTIATGDGGTHVRGLNKAVSQAITDAAIAWEMLEPAQRRTLKSADTREGLTAVIAVLHPSPEFEGQTKNRLGNPEVQGIVQSIVARELAAWLEANRVAGTAIVERALAALRARVQARRMREQANRRLGPGDIDEGTYRHQFGVRSANWHDSAVWIAHDELLAAHAAMCQVPRSSRLLDVCCGSGVVGHAFKDRVAHTTGLDLTPEMVALASERLDTVVQGNVFSVPFDDASYEIVVNREVMHLFPYPKRMLHEVFRVLKPGGQFVFGQIVPYGVDDAAWMHRIFLKKQPLLHHMFLAEDLVDLLGSIGFERLETREIRVWESIDTWIDTFETTRLHRLEIRDLFYSAPAAVKAIHPFEIQPDGRIRDLWRWVVFSCFKPGELDVDGSL